MPAHGEDIHLAEHAEFAKAQGVPEVVRARNGIVVRLAPGPAEIVDDVPAGRIYKDGDIVIDASERALPERRKLAFTGIVSVAIAIDRRGEVAGDPVIDIMGIPDKDRRGGSIPDLVAETVGQVLDSLPQGAPPRPRGGRGRGRAGGPLGVEERLGQEARLPCAGGRGMRFLRYSRCPLACQMSMSVEAPGAVGQSAEKLRVFGSRKVRARRGAVREG